MPHALPRRSAGLPLLLLRHHRRPRVVIVNGVNGVSGGGGGGGGGGGHGCASRAPYSALSSAVKITTIPAPHTASISLLSLNRPQARNALSVQLLGELDDVVEGLHREGGRGPTRALILASESDDAFCAGADLKERSRMTPDEVSTFLHRLRATFTRLSTLPIPTIAAVAGPALGGGLELALCARLRVFASTATVGLPETRLAIVPGAGGTFRLPALVGETRARDMILTGRRVGAAEAYFWGLCDRLVEVEVGKEDGDEGEGKGVARAKVLEHAVALAREICEGGPVAVRAALGAVDGWRRGQESENAAYEMVLPTEDRREALRAFAEKRKPVYKGR